MKAIGSDPTLPGTYMPSMNLEEIRFLDYDFLPDTTHMLQFEQPGQCTELVLAFLRDHALA